MNSVGLGVMIKEMFGAREDADIPNKKITKITLVRGDTEVEYYDDGSLLFEFDDATKFRIMDDGRSCCEARYMTTDDNLDAFVGATLHNVEVRYIGDNHGEYGSDIDCHEQAALVVFTSKGEFTVVTHNEHNGYYGGFYLVASNE